MKKRERKKLNKKIKKLKTECRELKLSKRPQWVENTYDIMRNVEHG